MNVNTVVDQVYLSYFDKVAVILAEDEGSIAVDDAKVQLVRRKKAGAVLNNKQAQLGKSGRK